MGTHPIFESDFDCLTEVLVSFKHGRSVLRCCQGPKDLFKKPFNAGQKNVDIKSGAFTLKNSVKGEAFSSNLEFKGADAFLGLGKGLTLPYTKKYDGKTLKFEMTKQFLSGDNKLDVDVNTAIDVASASYNNVIKTKLTAPNVIAGAEIPVSDMQKATFHAATDFKGMTVGLSGSVANPAALNYVFAPNKNTILETDLKNYTLHLYNKVDASTAIAARTSWETGSANSDFAVAVKKTLASGADFSVKAGVSGTVDLAHVSNLSDGVK